MINYSAAVMRRMPVAFAAVRQMALSRDDASSRVLAILKGFKAIEDPSKVSRSVGPSVGPSVRRSVGRLPIQQQAHTSTRRVGSKRNGCLLQCSTDEKNAFSFIPGSAARRLPWMPTLCRTSASTRWTPLRL